ncbi:putative DNA repair protein Nse1 [Stachybotrys elegans]|uniref:Non-structural maintenance of chromosomes element 1 homolog n=1 Tax=Stachybotrys elegans TaxID=80388 RepID=A0A8K0SXN1_9HYPO|nr:putative DNA repair protein Nse1 [Stachybotrys elegans]
MDHQREDRHKAFLQAFLARGTMTFEEAQPVIAAIMTAANGGETEVRSDQVSESDFFRYIDKASEIASLFDYEIRNILHQVSGKRIYAFVNTASDPQTQLATTYSPDELSFIKRLLDAIFDKYNSPRMEVLAVTEMQAFKLARPDRRQSVQADEEDQSQATDRGLKHSEVENVLANLIDGGWLEKSRAGFYTITPRALLELRPWLTETYNDPDAGPNEWQRIKFCEACKDIVTIGLRCSERDCVLRLHDNCQDAFWRTVRGENCPKCSRQWTGQNYVGERAITKTEAYERAHKRGGPRKSNVVDEILRQEASDDEGDEQDE